MAGETRAYFDIAEYQDYLKRCMEAGVVFEPMAKLRQVLDRGNVAHFMKHDIHGDFDGATAMARRETDLGVCATYFMMHRHPLNRAYYDQANTWKSLRHIQDLGHEVAIHVDGFVLIERYGDLGVAIVTEMKRFLDEGLTVRGGNTHGNTKYYRATLFEPMNFYRELVEPDTCKDEKWLSHLGKYSLQELGFTYWADPVVWWNDGKIRRTEYYLSDNSKCWRIRNLSDPDKQWRTLSEEFRLDSRSIERTVEEAGKHSCTYLVHPQFYRI